MLNNYTLTMQNIVIKRRARRWRVWPPFYGYLTSRAKEVICHPDLEGGKSGLSHFFITLTPLRFLRASLTTTTTTGGRFRFTPRDSKAPFLSGHFGGLYGHLDSAPLITSTSPSLPILSSTQPFSSFITNMSVVQTQEGWGRRRKKWAGGSINCHKMSVYQDRVLKEKRRPI